MTASLCCRPKNLCFSKCLQYAAFKGDFLQRAYQKEGNQHFIFTENLKVSAIFLCKCKECTSRTWRSLEKHLLRKQSNLNASFQFRLFDTNIYLKNNILKNRYHKELEVTVWSRTYVIVRTFNLDGKNCQWKNSLQS